MYDCILGGAHNFAVDRALAEQVRQTSPSTAEAMRLNRIFLRKAVRFLAEQGMRQFLDIGSGIPTVGNVHEVAQQTAPDARVVYVDVDPVAVAHSEAILEGNSTAQVLRADVREPDRVLAEASETGLIDFDQPVALLMVALLHFIPDFEAVGQAVASLRSRLAPGSYLAITHATFDCQKPDVTEAIALSSRTPTPLSPRTHEQVLTFFGDLELVDPGLVFLPDWRPDPGTVVEHPERGGGYAGIGRRV